MLTHTSSRLPTEVATELQFMSTPSVHNASSLALSPSAELRSFCEQAIASLPSEAAALRSGKSKGVLNKLVGHIMKQSRGRVDAVAARQMVEKLVLGASDADQGSGEQ